MDLASFWFAEHNYPGNQMDCWVSARPAMLGPRSGVLCEHVPESSNNEYRGYFVCGLMDSEDMLCSLACERNKQSIAEVLTILLPRGAGVLEIGSGTGQHAVYFAAQLPCLSWKCSDRADNLPSIQARIDLEGHGQLPEALELDVTSNAWPSGPYDAVFTANTLHIMPWDHTPVLLQRSQQVIKPGGCLIIYGPFHDGGVHTAPSNKAFDRSLKARDPAMGVRDAVEIKRLAAANGISAEADLALPANNRILVFRKPVDAPT